MIEPLIYCKVCGMAMQCIADFYRKNARRPVVLEIGCAEGQGTMRYAGFCERVICVDPMVEGRPDVFSTNRVGIHVSSHGKIDEFKRRTREFPVELIVGCSLWPDVIDQVRNSLGGDRVDVLIIDGCHHPFEAVWGDFVAYYPFVSQGGFVIFDDLYEECIFKAYQKAQEELGMVEHERWSVRRSNIFQDVGSLVRMG